MSISLDRTDVGRGLTSLLPQIAASATLATAAVLVGSIDYRQTFWEWGIWPRFLQASVLLMVSAVIALTLLPRRSWFTRCFACAALGFAVLRALQQVNSQIPPAVLWPNTLLVVVLSISGAVMLVFNLRPSISKSANDRA